MIDRRTMLETLLSLAVLTILTWVGYHVTSVLLPVAI